MPLTCEERRSSGTTVVARPAASRSARSVSVGPVCPPTVDNPASIVALALGLKKADRRSLQVRARASLLNDTPSRAVPASLTDSMYRPEGFGISHDSDSPSFVRL